MPKDLNYHLYIDELGVYSLKDNQSDLYILCGCAINNAERESLKVYADQIKYRFWQRTDVLLHSYDIGKHKGDFSIFLRNPQVEKEFLEDLLRFLRLTKVIVFPIVIIKEKAKKKNWNDEKIIKESVKNLYFHYISFLLSDKKRKGSITIESSTTLKDKYYLETFMYFLSPGSKEFGSRYREIQDLLTSIKFVTKKNNDVEEQIADLFSYAIKCKFEKDTNSKIFSKESYESKIIRILESKLFYIGSNLSPEKHSLLKNINSFHILP